MTSSRRVGLDVDVDVRRPVALGREEPLEQQPVPHRVDGGDPQRVADRRVGGRAAALRHDPVAPAEVDQVVDHEEVPGEPEVLDDRSSCASCAYAPGTFSDSGGPYSSSAPRRTSSRSQVASVCPSGTG